MDTLNNKKREFRSLLSNNGIISTLNALREFILEQSKKTETLILIKSFFNELKKRNQQGVLSWETVHLEENGVRKKLLDLR